MKKMRIEVLEGRPVQEEKIDVLSKGYKVY